MLFRAVEFYSNPDQTLFMRKGAKYGAEVKNGLEMLLLQAFASWEFWHEK